MPWRKKSVLGERKEFILMWLQDRWTVSELCRRFGISRVTGYKFIKRYQAAGWDGLKDLSRAPHRRGRKA